MESSDTSAKKEQLKAIRFDLSRQVQHNESTSLSRLSKGARGCWQEKEIDKGKTKYLSIEEVMKMPTGHMVKRNPQFGCSRKSEQLHPFITSNNHINLSGKKGKEKDDILSPAKENNQLKRTANVLPSAKDNEGISGKLRKAASKELCASRQSVYCQPPIMSGISSISRTRPIIHGAEDKTMANIVFSVEDFYLKIATGETLPTDPTPDASWMGSFKLKDEQVTLNFKAHPPSRCRRKVYEFSKRMPKVLEFELLTYQDFLLNVFEGYNPDGEDIGLYFFPHNIKRSSTYKSHLEHLSEQSYMRSCINGVELFVFTSKVLQEDSHKLNKYDFLWGVYRPVKNKLIENAMVDTDGRESNTIPECSGELEMKVDTIAGEYVGRRDVVIPKQSLSRKKGNDVPPRFGSTSGGKRKHKL